MGSFSPQAKNRGETSFSNLNPQANIFIPQGTYGKAIISNKSNCNSKLTNLNAFHNALDFVTDNPCYSCDVNSDDILVTLNPLANSFVPSTIKMNHEHMDLDLDLDGRLLCQPHEASPSVTHAKYSNNGEMLENNVTPMKPIVPFSMSPCAYTRATPPRQLHANAQSCTIMHPMHAQNDLSPCAQNPHSLSENAVPEILNFLTPTPSLSDLSTPMLSEVEAENSAPEILIFLTPTPSEVDAGEREEYHTPVINSTPRILDFSTPMLSEVKFVENSALSLTNCNDSCDESLETIDGDLDSAFHLQKYISREFIDKKDINDLEVSQVLKNIRIKNINRVIIGHLNVNFFAVKLDAIKMIISGNIDIMVFCETKLDASYPMAQLLIDAFGKPFRLDRNAHGGGLLIYVRSDIPCKQVNNHEFSDGMEGIFVEINFRKLKWLLLGTYHPPSQNDNFYFNNIGCALDIYMQNYDKFIFIGDFNAEEDEVILGDFMELYDLKNLVKEKTCFKSVENPSCVDLFLTNCRRSFQNTNVISTGVSDCHKMIVTVLKTTFKKAKPKETIYRSYRNFDNDAFCGDLKHNLEFVNGNYTKLEKMVLEVYNFHAPLKKRLVRANELPYMTKNMRKAIANRSRLENKYYKNKSVESLRAYKKQKNFCSRLYKKERKKYYTNLDPKKVTDSKKFWKTAKPFFSDKGVGKNDITLIEGNEIFQEDSEVAKILGDLFSNAVKSLNISIPSEYKSEASAPLDDPIDKIISMFSNHPNIKLIKENVANSSFSFCEVTSDNVEKEICALDSKKATMSSSIPPKVLKENITIFCKPLTDIINNGISSSCFDDGLKLADLTPIHKENDTTSKKNYRNISLLPVVSKLFEKLMQYQISAYMEKFLSPFLCGYRKGYSAQHALLSMLEKWRISLDKGGYGGGVLMDLSKAFDTLDHDLLIAKLHAYGFDKQSLRLIKSYLSDRWQRTKINTSYSSWSALLVGVPQGSVLGPLLFNLFINDLFFIIKTYVCNYADDNTPYAVDMCLEDLMAKLECAANSAIEWFRYNGMKLNSGKCHVLVCGHKFESMICKIGNSLVVETHLVKLLGIKIDSKLKFETHIETVCKKASQKLNALSRLCSIIPFHKRKILMQAYFYSQFSYSPLVWMFHSRRINTRINKLHFRAPRIVYLDDKSSFEELLRKDSSVTIHHRNLQLLAIEMYKVSRGIGPVFMNDIFPKCENMCTDNVSANTRSHSNFYNSYNPRSVNYGLNTLRSFGPKVWQMIPNHIKESLSLSVFKNKIKKWMPHNCPCRLCKCYVPQLGYLQ